MKLSRNVIFTEIGQGEFIAACTLTRAVIKLSAQGKADLERGDPSQLIELSLDDFQQCAEMKFLVDDQLDERNWLSYLMNKDRLSPYDLTTFIAFTTECNFDCVYCYEKGQVIKRTMTRTMLEKTVSWHQRKLERGNYKSCNINLYGGEPLTCVSLVLYFLDKMKVLTQSMGIKLKTRLLTNGYLLNKDIVEKLLPYGLIGVHVTIDGGRETHNVRRPLKNGRGTFDVVFNNLVAISKMNAGPEIECRISVDGSNINSIPEFLYFLKEKDVASNIEPYFGFITQTTSQFTRAESFCSRFVLGDDARAETILGLYGEAKRIGFKIPDVFTLGPCMVVAEGAGVISPDGNIYKCLDMIGNDKLIVDNVNWDEPNPTYFDFLRAEYLDHCISTDCPFVPLCGTGCAMEAYLANGDFQQTICHRPMLEKINQGLLKLQFT